MSDLLITVGDSFTYGEGLQFHLWNDRYNHSYKRFHGKTSYEPCQTVSSNFTDFYNFRKDNNYTGVLSKLIGTQNVSNEGNGGSNYKSIETLDIWIDYIKSEPILLPKFCVFQFTNVIRDIIHASTSYRSSGGYFSEIYDDVKYLIAKQNSLNTHTKNDILEMNPMFLNVFKVMLNEVKKRFKILEETYQTKCAFFIGCSEEYSRELILDYIKEDIQYVPMILGETEYADWDTLNRKNKWTLRGNINVNDDHPCLESHNWVAQQLHKKYLEISQ